MKRMFKSTLALLLAATMVVSGIALAPRASADGISNAKDLAAKMVGNTVERFDEITVADRTCFMFAPESGRVGNFLGLTPVIIVFGDEAFTAESVRETAETKGFAEIARRDGICVLFVNPITSWDSEEDAAAADSLFSGIFKVYHSAPALVFENGIAVYEETMPDPDNPFATVKTGETREVYPGSIQGVQMFGEGKGADYIAANYLDNNNPYDAYYANQVFNGLVGSPSGVALFQPTAVPENQTEGLVIPMAIVNGPENSAEAAMSYNQNIGVSRVVRMDGLQGFDRDQVITLYKDVVDQFYYSQGQFRQFPQYSDNGIVELNGWLNLDSGRAIEYYEYVSEDLDLSQEGTIPMLIWMHGFGGEGEWMFSCTEWPEIAREEGFIAASLDQHTQGFTGDELMDAIDKLIAENPWVDTSRIYLGGFSFGSMNTWNVGLRNWNRFAAIIPNAGGVNAMTGGFEGVDEIIANGGILPVFYIAGGQSAMELPTNEAIQDTLKRVWRLNEIGEYTYDPEAGYWGQAAATETTIAYNDESDFLASAEAKQQVMTISSFESTDGNTYTWLAVNWNKPHTITNADAHRVWENIKGFSRNPDGTLNLG